MGILTTVCCAAVAVAACAAFACGYLSSGGSYSTGSSWSNAVYSSCGYNRNGYYRRNRQVKEKPKAKPKKPKLRYIEVLKIYRPQEELLDFDDVHKEEKQYLLGQNLTACNIQPVFENLLQLEDVEVLKAYLPLIQQNVSLQMNDEKNYEIPINKCPSTNIFDVVTPYCDEVVIIPSIGRGRHNLKKYLMSGNEGIFDKSSIAIISDVSRSKLKVAFKENPMNLENVTRVDVVIRPRREPLRYQRRALELLQQNILMRQYLFPDYILGITRFAELRNLYNVSIQSNPEQYMAVQNIVSGAGLAAPYIVFGPPGTGKTTTIVESILQLYYKNPCGRILITAASNSACDTIAVKLCQHLSGLVKPLLRIYSKSILTHSSFKHIPNCLLMQSNLYWDEGKHAYPAVEDVNKYKIVIANLSTIGKYDLANFAKTKRFDYLFIDEAGATSEPEALIAIMAVNLGTHIILSGDHKQLGPVIKSKLAAAFGLGKSLMERLLERKCYAVEYDGQYNRNLQIRLRRNYRSDPKIVQLYNSLYYDNDLIANRVQSVQSNWSFLPNPASPIVFQSVYGQCIKGTSSSWGNMLEVKVLIAYIRLLLKVHDAKESDIGVITPYKEQSELIHKVLRSLKWSSIEVGSVENFQGREKLIIIASLVRSNHSLGFLKCARRWNVLISRPKCLLLILGNPATLNKFNDMKYVIDECERAGNYLGRKNLQINKHNDVEIVNVWKK